MNITYREQKVFAPSELAQLFLSVGWESGNFPNRLAEGLKNSTEVISAWDEEKLIGLVRGLSDGATAAFIHYLLVDPNYRGAHIGSTLLEMLMEKYDDLLYVKVMPSDSASIAFYERFGFRCYDNYSAMVVKRLDQLSDRQLPF